MIEPHEEARRRALIAAHYAVENDRDIDRIMQTFARDAVMVYNGQRFAEPEQIRWAHAYIGFGPDDGAFTDVRNLRDAEHCTADEIVVEGRLQGRHVGEFQGHAPTGREVTLPFVAFYRFDADGLLVSERVVMNLGMLGTAGAPLASEHRSG